MNIKVGDRVRWINANAKVGVYYPPVGTCGTVTYIDRVPSISGRYTIKVKWDSGAQGDGCWYCYSDEVTLVEADFTKCKLKTGDVCLQRNGLVQIFNKGLGIFITKDSYNDLESFNDDLTSQHGSDYDIVAVRRPIQKSDCVYSAFAVKRGKLIYERKEVEEMTLEQVCKLLGKEIKIIK